MLPSTLFSKFVEHAGVLSKDAENFRKMLEDLPCYDNHPVVQRARAAGNMKLVRPIALYWDGVRYSVHDSFTGFYVTDILSGQKFVSFLLRSSTPKKLICSVCFFAGSINPMKSSYIVDCRLYLNTMNLSLIALQPNAPKLMPPSSAFARGSEDMCRCGCRGWCSIYPLLDAWVQDLDKLQDRYEVCCDGYPMRLASISGNLRW